MRDDAQEDDMASDGQHNVPVTRRRLLQQVIVGGAAAVLYPRHLASCSTQSGAGGAVRSDTPRSDLAITAAAQGFLRSLGAEQRDSALFALDDDRRQDWHYVPKVRKGVPYKKLDPEQRRLADVLIGAGLSQRGFEKFATIRSLEPILYDVEHGQGPVRDSELYYVSLFGVPEDSKPWGWSLEGHHVSLNFTVVDRQRIASTPSFLGANPAEVRHGARTGLRALSSEEDAGRRLVTSLSDEQRAQAVVTSSAPGEILSGSSRKAERVQPAGLPAAKLAGAQRELLIGLLEEYAGSMATTIATARMSKVRAAGLENIHFAWAGELERGKPHYYRVQGPSFLVEYDNTQNDANHVHTVWRDFDGDFGLDLLAEHYDRSHR